MNKNHVERDTTKQQKTPRGSRSRSGHRDPATSRENQIPRPVTFKDAVQVKLDHRIKCAWATFTSHRQELTSPECFQKDRLKLFDATVTAPLRTRYVDDDGRDEAETPDNTTTQDEDDLSDEEKIR